MTRPIFRVETARTRRWPGYLAIVWFDGQVFQVLFDRDFDGAYALAWAWIERYKLEQLETELEAQP